MIKVAPSILSADFGKLGDEIKAIEEGGADLVHVDVMDGNFVPNITIGPVVVKSIRPLTEMPFDVHLMVQKPQDYVEDFIKAGADILTVHVESDHSPHETIKQIHDMGKQAGVVLNPGTPFHIAKDFLNEIEMILIMTVNPGFGGQKFMPEVIPKIKEAKDYIDSQGLSIDLEVDGGITSENAGEVASAGGNILVAGSFVYRGNPKETIASLRAACEQ
ncbi:MAG: ribulose-phosphate 3-epimerase [Methanobacteriota archaeon]|nr:MAG: ribulose-phosphate 3-epimerase [Euryarchaeota archaeon]